LIDNPAVRHSALAHKEDSSIGLELERKNIMHTFPKNLRHIVLLTLIISPLLALFVLPAHAAAPQGTSIQWFTLLMGLFGGLALFLAGLEVLSEGMKLAAGATLKHVLSKLTTNRFLGALTGAFVTGVLNSSSVTTVLVVGFVTAGVMTLAQSVGVIMGANIGSTVTAQILAFNVSQYALLPIAVGFFMIFSGKKEQLKHYGMMLMGFGLVFYGMGIMSDAMRPLRDYAPFLELLERMENPALGILAGAVFTGLVQSSAATVGIAIAMASEGLLSLPAGIALALGANIGTCVTALLAALGKPVEAVRAAVVHVIFNVMGVLIWIAFIPALADLAVWISPSNPELDGTARMAAEVPRQIANANTLFNVVNTLVFIGFTAFFARLAVRLVPEKPEPVGIIIEPKYLDNSVLAAPSLALERVRLELGRVGEITEEMLADWPDAVRTRDHSKLNEIAKRDDQVDTLEAAILEYLSRIRQHLLTEKESNEHQSLMAMAISMENIADVIETDLTDLAKQFFKIEHESSETTAQMLRGIYDAVARAVSQTVQAARDNDQAAAAEVMRMDDEIKRLSGELLARRSERLGRTESQHLAAARMDMSFIDKMRRIYSLAKRIAREVLPKELAIAA
jgi:phosphate:Na+ symporter